VPQNVESILRRNLDTFHNVTGSKLVCEIFELTVHALSDHGLRCENGKSIGARCDRVLCPVNVYN
jgi:hypothetical protein